MLWIIQHEDWPRVTLVILLPSHTVPQPDPCSKKRNLFGRLKLCFSLSPLCLAECVQCLGGNRQRWTVKFNTSSQCTFAAQALGDL